MFRIASSCNGKSCTNKYEESVGSKRAIPSEFPIRTQDLLYIFRHVRRWRKWRTKKKRLRSKTVNYNLKNYHKIIDIVTVSTNLLRFFFFITGEWWCKRNTRSKWKERFRGNYRFAISISLFKLANGDLKKLILDPCSFLLASIWRFQNFTRSRSQWKHGIKPWKM